MKMFLLGFLVCYCLASTIIYIDKEWIIEPFIKPFYAATFIIAFIPYTLYHLFRHLFTGVTQEALKRVLDLPHFNIGRIYFFWDGKAHYLWNKAFVVRVKGDDQRAI